MLFLRIFLTSLLFSSAVFATPPSLEYKVKAAYLFNFTKFISWPEIDSESFNLCVVQPNPFGPFLEPLKQRQAVGKPIQVYLISNTGQVSHCHLLYLDKAKKIGKGFQSPEMKGVLTVSSLGSVLNVSSQPFFARDGGMIGFVLRDGRVKLEINLNELKRHGFQVSSKLMEVAERVDSDD